MASRRDEIGQVNIKVDPLDRKHMEDRSTAFEDEARLILQSLAQIPGDNTQTMTTRMRAKQKLKEISG